MFPVGPNKAERLRALEELDILNRPRNARFDAICAEACQHFAVPIALVTLLDRQKQRFGGCVGLAGDDTARDVAFCNYTVLQDAVFVVPDALADERFKTNPLVTGEPFIRFYAGAPLIYREGVRLGAFCLIDMKPRTFTRGDRAELTLFADRVATEIMLRQPALVEPLLAGASPVGPRD
jgi:GAF domain-containing protein